MILRHQGLLLKNEANTGGMGKAEKEFRPQFCGWKMSHKYRAKNGFGAFDISTDVFYFDKELTKIVDVEDNN